MKGHLMRSMRSRVAAFTLVELMIVVALLAIIVTLAAPSLREMILMQRLRSVHAQVIADLAWARSEAISRGTFMQLRFQSSSGDSGMSCYIIYARQNVADSPLCDCLADEGSRCTGATTEVRTVRVPNSESIHIDPPAGGLLHFTFDPRTGGIALPPSDLEQTPRDQFRVETYIDNARKVRAVVGLAGRTTVCVPPFSRMSGTAC